MKRVLILAYYWPPAGGVAVQRYLKFTRYLPQYGWKPIVIAPRNGSYQYHDELLLKELSPETEVHLTDTFEPFELYNLLQGRKGKSANLAVGTGKKEKSLTQKISEYIRANFFIPDARKGWVKYAVREAGKIIAKQKIDAVITTSPPHSAQLAGLKIKQKYNLPWVADFRDPWSTILYNDFLPRTKATIEKDKKLEAAVLKNADKIVLISPGMKDEFVTPLPNAQVIYNGYDEDDYTDAPVETTGFFTLRYVGNFLATENPPGLWRALQKLLTANASFAQYFRFEITGRIDP
ncbi:MAG TPA: glycosyltransferase, partial [Chitinophagales bacterium]|nr:glycosyltransferase [Chitinophagales bacterium]